MAMLTAEGTRERLRAAAENEPWSNTDRKTWMLSEEKAILGSIYQKN